MSRRTKIVATIGPASDEPESLERLIAAGVDVVRLNLSHGSIDEHLVAARTCPRGGRRSSVARSRVLADLPGPKIRAGQFPAGGVTLSAGEFVQLRAGDGPATPARSGSTTTR